ncbi:bifunctional adenosylcobinamide kinase/adenosylcobinamide-phosphate guanylyltransferase [Falsochrobactrum ovis]|uniref:Bifunctional adenosylcobalamin biosynthesis protein n=1 Tax=Falsochrobactrum ovis TaxID=1293442 RepID=A0A364JXT6_9HYPH|nr:bifunctional adenosylcobinamide kinase/adenosylcobinamide-phosphate guanylyltransferase [Falsochrobactrum ovis]RAK32219.1 adenosylcobinamide kinase /adenosylcobinamide-phosphate guanylyltransferase [Falsochrobactrum ovis]
MAAKGRIIFVLGGARSGKSSYAEGLIEASGLKPIYLATGRAFDSEMEERIDIHRAGRSEHWRTIEEPLALIDALSNHCAPDCFVLVDCLTLWLTNLMLEERDIKTEVAALLDALPQLNGPVVFVSNEVGLGIVPDNQMARDFRDYAGFLHQDVASCSDEVYFMAAGLPLKMKG